MDRLEAMQVFVEIIDAGSLSAASRRLGMPLATVSRKLSELETRLGTRLLIRSTRRLTLSDAGSDYLAACRRVLEDVEQAERAAAGEYAAPRGELVITAPMVYGRMHLLPVVTDFLLAYPDIDVRMVFGDRQLDLQEDHIDLAIRIGALPDSSMIAMPIGATRRVVCAAPSYLDTHGRPATPSDLARHRSITFEGLGQGSWSFQGAQSIDVELRPRLRLSTAEAAIDAAQSGLGLTRVMAYQIAGAVRQGRLETVLDDFETRSRPIHALHLGQGRMPLKLRAFLDFSVPRLRERLHGNA